MRIAHLAVAAIVLFTTGFLITSNTAAAVPSRTTLSAPFDLVYVPPAPVAAPATTAPAKAVPDVTPKRAVSLTKYIPPPAAVAVIAKRVRAFAFALTKRGGPYVWGGNGPRGYDCSGLVVASYANVGIHLPRTTYGILGSGKLRRISKNQARPGDLWFPSSGHVEFYYTTSLSFGAHHSGTLIGARSYYTGGSFYHVIGS